MAEKILTIDYFYTGQTKETDQKGTLIFSNIEELDFFSEESSIKPTTIFKDDTMPTGTGKVYAFTADDSDNLYALATQSANGQTRILKLASASSNAPGTWTTFFDSSNTAQPHPLSQIVFFQTSEVDGKWLYFVRTAGATKEIARIKLTATPTETNTDAGGTVMTISGLTGSYDRPTMKVIYGELYICHGRFIAKVNEEGVFTEKAFTLPREWRAVDIIPIGDASIILTRHINSQANVSRGYWWDLTDTAGFIDFFEIPFGGAQWIYNVGEKILIFCAINGRGKVFQLASPNAGSSVIEIDHIEYKGLKTETSTQPISPVRTVQVNDGILYFALWGNKTGIYALGQTKFRRPLATCLAKRFNTTDYSLHTPYALIIHGPNWFVSYDDNNVAKLRRLENNNNPTYSSQAVIESNWLDFGNRFSKKTLTRAYLVSEPLPTGTSIDFYVAGDYSGTYTQIKRPDDTIFNTANGIFGFFKPSAFKDKRVYKFKIQFTSSGNLTPKLHAIGFRFIETQE